MSGGDGHDDTREECSRKKGQGARRPPDGQGVGTMAGQKARAVVASHMRGRRGDRAQIGKGLSDG